MVDEIVDFSEENSTQEEQVKEETQEVSEKVEKKPEPKQEKKPAGRKKKESNSSDIGEKTQELYSEFSSFLRNNDDIAPNPEPTVFIPTGIDILDAVMGGGFALGTFSVVAGFPASGKSMICCQTIAQAQKIFGKDLICVYLDSEESTSTARLSSLGVNNPKIKPYNNVTIEKVFKVIESLCLFKEEKNLVHIPSIVVWDSIANTLTEKEQQATDINQVIGYKAKVLSFLIPKYISKLSKYNISLMSVNQLRDSLQMGQFAPPKELKFMTQGKDIPGGGAIKFNAFHLIEMKVKSVTSREKLGFDGYIAGLRCVKNKAFSPNINIDIVGDFFKGFNNFYTNYNFLVDCKRLSTGAWNWLVELPTKKFRTKDAENFYNTDENFRTAFDDQVKQAIKTQIIDRYSPSNDEVLEASEEEDIEQDFNQQLSGDENF